MAHSHARCLEQASLGRRFVHRSLGPVSLRGTRHPVSGSCEQRIQSRGTGGRPTCIEPCHASCETLRWSPGTTLKKQLIISVQAPIRKLDARALCQQQARLRVVVTKPRQGTGEKKPRRSAAKSSTCLPTRRRCVSTCPPTRRRHAKTYPAAATVRQGQRPKPGRRLRILRLCAVSATDAPLPASAAAAARPRTA